MAKVEQHDIREFYTHSGQYFDVGAATTWYLCVPHAGYLARAYFVSRVAQITADATITFAIGGSSLTPTMVIPSSGGAIGRSHVVNFSRVSANYLYEPEGTDLVAAGAVLAVTTDGGGTGNGVFHFAIRP